MTWPLGLGVETPMAPRTSLISIVLVLTILAIGASPSDPAESGLERRFSETVRPFVTTYCTGCHTGEKAMAQFDLSAYTNLRTVIQDHARWALVMEKLGAKQMPPEGMPQPPAAARQAVIDWIDALRKHEARKNAGDPGIVLARRLSNAEYNYTVRDLTGVDIRPTREFPVDPANPAGFDNSGESLAMSPALLDKYLQAAREVAHHMVLKPDGIAFAPHLMLVETDRDKYCVNQIMDFYQRHATDYADYFEAAWRFKHRAALGRPNAALADFAAGNPAGAKISAKYLATVWRTFEPTKEEIGPLARLQEMWRELPAPRGKQPDLARDGAERMRDFVLQLRQKLEPRFPNLEAKGIPRGGTSQPGLMWKNRQYATHRMAYDRAVLQVEGEWKPAPRGSASNKPTGEADIVDEEGADVARRRYQADPDLHVPAGQRARYEAAFARFAAVFPDAFYVSERGRNYLDKTTDRGRFLSAGFHNLMGYFRDDIPLYELLLGENEQKDLDALWRELDFIAFAAHRTFIQFYLSESGMARRPAKEAESGPTRSDEAEEKDITSEATLNRVKETYLAGLKGKSSDVAVKAVKEHFDSVNATLRWVEQARIEAESHHREALQAFAARAYRRPLSPAERGGLLAFYRALREKSGLTHEDAMRDSIVSVLMSPDFCYRIDLIEAAGDTAAAPRSPRATAARTAQGAGRAPRPRAAEAPEMPGVRPLSDYALASRLSYFLWSSMPDQELLARAAASDLRRPEVLAAQARRMLKDPRAQALAVEFGGNWLDFRRFEEHNAVDRERFPGFTNELRQAMFEEPVRFFAEVIRHDRSILDFLYAKYTFVNGVLARHYGLPDAATRPDVWVRVDDARRYGRGGLLPMSAFLTKNAPGLRTSPVKRGYWVVRRVLGEQIPAPPAVVPELPRDEAKMDLPLREMLARHREEPSCASCHARFDSLGLAFEGYGPIGERRAKDLAGRPVDTKAEFPGGGEGAGFDGVLDYIRAHRQNEFVENLCRKMLVYALGRSLLLSDEPLVEETSQRLAANGHRFSTLVESIVTSPQFLNKRGEDVRVQHARHAETRDVERKRRE